MLNEYVFHLDAVLHEDLPSYTRIISKYDFRYYLWVKVSPAIAKYYSLYQLDEVSIHREYDLNLLEICKHDLGSPWFRLNTKRLDTSVGQHVYRMQFVHKFDQHTTSLFFSYIVQTECVEKPYIYMVP